MSNYERLKEKVFSSFLLRALVLISLKESYLFLRNLYGLVVHPLKTTAGILAKPDKSQTLLIFGLPGYLWFGALVFFLPVFWFIRNWYNARILFLLVFQFFSFLVFLLACYLLFWLSQFFLKWKLRQKNLP